MTNEVKFADHLRTNPAFKCGSLYFIREEGGPIKIGRSVDTRSRLTRLQTGNPRKLSLLFRSDGNGWQEAFWHFAFSDLHVAGEWFDARRCLLNAIKALSRGEDWLACVPQHPMDEELADDEFLAALWVALEDYVVSISLGHDPWQAASEALYDIAASRPNLTTAACRVPKALANLFGPMRAGCTRKS